MKTTILIPGIILIILSSCDYNVKNDKISELQKQLDSATHSLTVRDSVVTGYLDFVNTIQKNLNEIRSRESMLNLDKEDFSETSQEMRDNMISDLQKINNLMQENRQKIAVLSVNLKGSKTQVDKLRSLIEQLKQAMAEKENEVEKLNQQVAMLTNNNHILRDLNDSLANENEAKEEMISDQKETIESIGNQSSRAYYAAGPREELEKKNIIAKEGGVLGIGAVEQLNTNVELTNLQNIDIRNTFSIPLNTKKAELVTNHPKDSYKIVRNEKDDKIDKLLILDPLKFWASSRCLVVVTR
jgi:chromosome segregation ATPase